MSFLKVIVKGTGFDVSLRKKIKSERRGPGKILLKQRWIKAGREKHSEEDVEEAPGQVRGPPKAVMSDTTGWR